MEDHGIVLQFVGSFKNVLCCSIFFVAIEIKVRVISESVTLVEPPWNGVEHDNEDKELISNLSNNVSPHDWEDDLVRLLLSILLEFRWVGWFSGEGNSS